jgi:hypothetical protein
MNKFKQFVIEFAAPIIAIALPSLVAAQAPPAPGGITLPSTLTNISQIAGNGTSIICVSINWIFWFLIVLTIIFVLIAAFGYLTAAGDPEKVKTAGQRLLYAAVAIVVALIAKGLPLIVSSFIGGGFSGGVC